MNGFQQMILWLKNRFLAGITLEGTMKLRMSSPELNQDDRQAVLDVVNTPNLSMGPKIAGFEQAFCDLTGRKHAIGVNSGTAGLHLCVRASGIGPGDLVITTPFSFVASTNVILFEKAIRVFQQWKHGLRTIYVRLKKKN